MSGQTQTPTVADTTPWHAQADLAAYTRIEQHWPDAFDGCRSQDTECDSGEDCAADVADAVLAVAAQEIARLEALLGQYLDTAATGELREARLRTALHDVATYRLEHRNLGKCPDGPDDTSRDPRCPVCTLLSGDI